MKLLIVIAPERFRDEELFTPCEMFEKTDIIYDIASTKTGTCAGMIGGSAEATLAIADARAEEYDGIVVVGGVGSQDFLWDNAGLQELVRTFFTSGKVVAAICLSPVVLAQAGILHGRQATVFRTPASIRAMKAGGAHLVDMPVVADLDLITANGPQAAGRFAEMIIERLLC
ncbi:MAG: DJ-1/PfpI family protein [Methanomicrobiales archaeon]|nr:DJ-1/PfpI family protein [Methanomicrobiales archaeon]